MDMISLKKQAEYLELKYKVVHTDNKNIKTGY